VRLPGNQKPLKEYLLPGHLVRGADIVPRRLNTTRTPIVSKVFDLGKSNLAHVEKTDFQEDVDILLVSLTRAMMPLVCTLAVASIFLGSCSKIRNFPLKMTSHECLFMLAII